MDKNDMRRSEGTTATVATTTWWKIIYISFICQALTIFRYSHSLFFPVVGSHPPLFCEMFFFCVPWVRRKGKSLFCIITRADMKGLPSTWVYFYYEINIFSIFHNCYPLQRVFSHPPYRFPFSCIFFFFSQQLLKAIEDEKSIC